MSFPQNRGPRQQIFSCILLPPFFQMHYSAILHHKPTRLHQARKDLLHRASSLRAAAQNTGGTAVIQICGNQLCAIFQQTDSLHGDIQPRDFLFLLAHLHRRDAKPLMDLTGRYIASFPFQTYHSATHRCDPVCILQHLRAFLSRGNDRSASRDRQRADG